MNKLAKEMPDITFMRLEVTVPLYLAIPITI